jgi:GNAT superfamily N-acetyltransferase
LELAASARARQEYNIGRVKSRLIEPELRPAHPDECAALSALALRSKAVWGYSAEFMARCAAELTLREDHLPHVFVLETAAGVVGFYALSALEDGRVELEFLFIEPDALRQGHGRRLLAHARSYARDRMAARVLVIQGDPHADEFYRSLGARRVGERASASIEGRMLPLYELACS